MVEGESMLPSKQVLEQEGVLEAAVGAWAGLEVAGDRLAAGGRAYRHAAARGARPVAAHPDRPGRRDSLSLSHPLAHTACA